MGHRINIDSKCTLFCVSSFLLLWFCVIRNFCINCFWSLIRRKVLSLLIFVFTLLKKIVTYVRKYANGISLLLGRLWQWKLLAFVIYFFMSIITLSFPQILSKYHKRIVIFLCQKKKVFFSSIKSKIGHKQNTQN